MQDFEGAWTDGDSLPVRIAPEPDRWRGAASGRYRPPAPQRKSGEVVRLRRNFTGWSGRRVVRSCAVKQITLGESCPQSAMYRSPPPWRVPAIYAFTDQRGLICTT